jgi:hypothetical protein
MGCNREDLEKMAMAMAMAMGMGMFIIREKRKGNYWVRPAFFDQ